MHFLNNSKQRITLGGSIGFGKEGESRMPPPRSLCALGWGAWGLLALALASPAALADGYRGSVKDLPEPFSWTGFYIGGSAGLVTGETRGDLGLGGVLNTDYSLNGAL